MSFWKTAGAVALGLVGAQVAMFILQFALMFLLK